MKNFKVLGLMLLLFAGLFLAPKETKAALAYNNIYNLYDSGQFLVVYINGAPKHINKSGASVYATSSAITIKDLTGANFNFTKNDSFTPCYMLNATTRNCYAIANWIRNALEQKSSIIQNYLHQCAASTDSTLIYGHSGTILSINLVNASGTVRYVKLYDTAGVPKRASATVGTSPLAIIQIPANSNTTISFSDGKPFYNGLAIRYLGATGFWVNEDGKTASSLVPSAGDITLNLTYKKSN